MSVFYEESYLASKEGELTPSMLRLAVSKFYKSTTRTKMQLQTTINNIHGTHYTDLSLHYKQVKVVAK